MKTSRSSVLSGTRSTVEIEEFLLKESPRLLDAVTVEMHV